MLKGKAPLIVAIVLFVIGFGVSFSAIQKQKNDVRKGWNLVPVVVSAVDISEGTVVTMEMISQRSIPEQFVTSSVVKPDSASYIVNQKVLVALQSGDPLLWSQFETTKAAERLSTKVQKKARAITIEAKSTTAVGGWVRPNDHVDIIGTFKDPATNEQVAVTLLQNVIILATGKITGTTNINLIPENERAYGHVSLLVIPEEAEILVLSQELGSGAIANLYWKVEAPLMPVLVGMEETGIRLDVDFLRRMSAELADEISGLEAEIYRLAGERFNIQSPQQLGTILFEKLKLPAGRKPKKTKSYSTGADTLEELAAAGHEMPQYLLRYRELSKLKSTYVDALPQLLGADGRIHTRYQQAVAATGRLSSVNPNLQNIPIRTELGMKIRKAFCAAPGSLLVAADYSQIELRVLAHIAGEKAMIEAFRSGEDIHRSTAATVLGISVDFVNAEQRRAAKTINFGLIYGMSAYGLAQALGISTKEAEQFIAIYFARYEGVQAYMRETLAAAERDGRVETLYGRVRYLPDIQSKNWNLKENARRMAINARIQGTAADLMKLAMIAVDRRLRVEHPQARLLLSVHDELVVEVPADEAVAVAELVRTGMAGVAELAVPLVVDSGIGPTWFDAKG